MAQKITTSLYIWYLNDNRRLYLFPQYETCEYSWPCLGRLIEGAAAIYRELLGNLTADFSDSEREKISLRSCFWKPLIPNQLHLKQDLVWVYEYRRSTVGSLTHSTKQVIHSGELEFCIYPFTPRSSSRQGRWTNARISRWIGHFNSNMNLECPLKLTARTIANLFPHQVTRNGQYGADLTSTWMDLSAMRDAPHPSLVERSNCAIHADVKKLASAFTYMSRLVRGIAWKATPSCSTALCVDRQTNLIHWQSIHPPITHA